jgi:hypothetical protein
VINVGNSEYDVMHIERQSSSTTTPGATIVISFFFFFFFFQYFSDEVLAARHDMINMNTLNSICTTGVRICRA